MDAGGYTAWCETKGVTHAHCPYDCEHPQPFVATLKGETEAQLFCGRCWHIEGVVTPMVPCVPETCEVKA